MSHELFQAIEAHDVLRVRELLAQGADPDAQNADGWSALHLAIGELGVGGPTEIVAALIEHGADVNRWDAHRNEPPIISASYREAVDAARLLLRAGATPNVRRPDGETPLRLAVEEQDRELAALLLLHRAGHDIDRWGGLDGSTVLGMAARKFDVPMIELLLANGADPGALDEYDETARDKLPPRQTCDPREWDRVMELLGRCEP